MTNEDILLWCDQMSNDMYVRIYYMITSTPFIISLQNTYKMYVPSLQYPYTVSQVRKSEAFFPGSHFKSFGPTFKKFKYLKYQ